ncbi:SDR family NAD(P)-dependent oxidoreductase [Vibrio sonorensis]|uniref:SDR family NAD(P)-dependent oxidoreductase n=1 Tax=Vibrio sonorensis TaxID=1004316 RepID=UPI0008D99E3B|nr:SDR family oxidoreductase [Vibrio sonorensis]
MQIALVTGGTKGIGLSVVRRLVASGATVVTCSRTKESWQHALQQYPELDKVLHKTVDMTVQSDVDELFYFIQQTFSKLTIAVNNASPAIASLGKFRDLPFSKATQTLNSDFLAHAYSLQHELKLMEKGSVIINVSSVNGLRPTPNAAMYSAAKHALEGMTRTLALESVAEGIRVNAVAPGVTWSPRWQERVEAEPELKVQVEQEVPMGRFASCEEIADAIEFLISDKAKYITGHTLVVDGGLSLA